jgi:hypothetical protein
MGAEGAAYGAVGGLGGSRGTSASEIGEDVALGATVGGVLGAGMQGGTEGAVRLARGVDDPLTEANVLRYRALFEGDRPPRRLFREQFGPAGPQRAERAQEVVSELDAAGVRSASDAIGVASQGRDDLHRIARELDAAADASRTASAAEPPPPIVMELDSGGTAAARPRAGQRGPFRDEATTTDSPMQGLPDRIAERLRAFGRERRAGQGVGDDFLGELEREAQRWERAPEDGPMTFSRAWEFRKQMSDPAHWTVGPRGTMPISREVQRDIYQIIREEMETAAAGVDPGLARQWRDASRRVHTTLPMAQAADEAQLRGWQNQQVGLGDRVAMSGASGIADGAARWLASRVARRYEHGVLARGYDLVHRIAKTDPASLGTFGRALGAAARRGPGAFAATYYTLWHRDPAFAAEMRQLDEQTETP